MLKDRLRTSAILITVVAALLYLDGNYPLLGAEGLWLIPLLLFFAWGTAHDVATLIAGSGRPIARSDAMLGTSIVTLSGAVPLMWPIFGATYPCDCPVGRLGSIVIAAIAAVFLVLIAEMARYNRDTSDAESSSGTGTSGKGTSGTGTSGTGTSGTGTIERTCASVFVSLYVGLPMALLVVIRTTGSGNWGLAALLTMVAVTKSADAGAYFSGRSLGRNKLIPRLSPGKTREGAVGGIVTATIVAYGCLRWLFPSIAAGGFGPVATASVPALASPLWGALALGPLCAVSGMIGDLAESLVKRDSGAKDSGNLLPGLGGVWDVTDSLIAAVMPAFLCFAAGVGS